jgi:MFS family permease
MAYVAELAPVRRGERMGLFSSATLIGRSLAPMAGGLLLAYGFAPVYIGCAVAGVLALGLAFALPRPRQAERRESVTLRQAMGLAREGLRQTLRSPVILGASGAEATIYLCFGAVETFVPVHAVECGITKWQIGAIFMAQILTVALTKPILGSLSDRVICGGLLAGALAVAALSLSSGIWSLGTSVAAFGLALSAVTSATSALVSDASKAANYGAALGVLSTIMDIGQSTGPVLAGALMASLAYAGSFRIIAALPVVAAALVLWASRKRCQEPFPAPSAGKGS